MKQKSSKFIKSITRLTFLVFVKPFLALKLGYRSNTKYKIRKGEPVLVLSNHQTDLDPLYVHWSFNKVLNCVATDTIFKKGFIGWFLKKNGAIPKRKGLADLSMNMEIIRSIKNDESVLLFAEGNRTYADFQFYITDKISRLLKAVKCTVILYNLHGGTGISPRFANKRRKGKFYGEIKMVLEPKEYMEMDDDKLSELIITNLRVIDSESGELYKSNQRAEYLERMYFLCPHCGAISSMVSAGNTVKCKKCDFEMEFGEDLKLHRVSKYGPDISMKEWYNLQKKWTLNYLPPKDQVIFKDKDVVLVSADPYQKRKTLFKGKMVLTDKELSFGEIRFPLGNINIASPISGTKLAFSDSEHNYLVKGSERFNPLKYVLMFNRLETNMNLKGNDNYYRLEVDEK